MLKKIQTSKSHHKITFAIVIAASVISVWRGLWGLLDIYLFPQNVELSYWISLVAGLFVLYITHYIVKELM